MDGPLARQAGNERRVSSFCTVYATYVTSSADRAVHTGLRRPPRRAAWWRRAAAATHGDRPAKFLRETEKFSTDRLAKA